ncbi:SCO family protein [Rugamonas rivuli]|uniref:SCO family protein n=1 Tax=Rugamonas rivuli TaxID=2743358 RepID=UPI002E26C069
MCAVGMAALYQGTMGFEVVSTEDGRRLAVSRQPRELPAAAERMLGADGRVAIVVFFYSSCNAVCSVLGTEFQQMQQEILRRGLQREVRLVSISFDPRDTPPVLANYAKRLHADPALWRMVSVDRELERKAVLDAFGIVVLPAPLGEFQHNAAFHLVDTQGRLARIDDYEEPAQALEHALQLARTTPRGRL